MTVITDERALEDLAHDLVARSPKQAAGYRAGKTNLLGFFVGQMMKQTGGSADPAAVNRVLKRVLEGSAEAAPERAPAVSGTHLPEGSGSSSGMRHAELELELQTS